MKIPFYFILFCYQFCYSQLNLIDGNFTRDFVNFDNNYTYYLSIESGNLNSKLKRIDQFGSTFNVNSNIGIDAKKMVKYGTDELIFSSKNTVNIRTLYKYNISTSNLSIIDNDIIDVGNEMININGKVYFLATKNATSIGMELYVYDGTSVNLISDINNSFISSNAKDFRQIEFNGENYLILSAENPNGHRNLYKFNSDIGSALEQITNLTITSGTSTPSQLYVLESFDKLAYTMRDNSDGINGFQIWFYDFLSNSNTRITNYNPTTNQGTSPTNLIEKDNNLYFSGTNDNMNRNLFFINLNNNSVNLINGSQNNINPEYIAKYDNELYFSGLNTNSEKVLSYLNSGVITYEDQQSYYPKNITNIFKDNNQIYFGIINATTDTQKEFYVFDMNSNTYLQLTNSYNTIFKPFLKIGDFLYVLDGLNKLYSFNTQTLDSNSFIVYESLIFPNPVKSSFKLKLESSFDFKNIEIYDLSGKIVTKFNTLRNDYNISYLKSGIYIVHLNLKQSQIYFKLTKIND